MRTATIERKTRETQIRVTVNLDGGGEYSISTGIGFLDHMLEQLSRHSLIDLGVEAKGDLHIDFHHTNEDTAIAIGEAVSQALGDRAGITRYGDVRIPMDETLTRVTLDISNRPYLIWQVEFTRPKLGEMDTELFKEWFRAFAQAAGITIHVRNAYGENSHHIIESCFKAFAKENDKLVIKGGVLDGNVISESEIMKLADLESREVLLAKAAGAMKASLFGAAYLFQAPLAQAARAVDALRAKQEDAA